MDLHKLLDKKDAKVGAVSCIKFEEMGYMGIVKKDRSSRLVACKH